MRRLALVTLLAFGCATVREPAQPSGWPPPPAPPQVALAEPELELWLEGTRPVDPEESAAALEAARNALSHAVEGRGVAEGEPDQLLVVRARAIKVTEERRKAQLWSTIGIVAAFVAVVVVAIVASRSGSKAPRSSPAVHRAAPAGGGRVPGRYFAPRPYAPPPPIGVAVGFNVLIPPPGAPLAPPPGAPPMEARLAERGWFDGDEVELTVELVHPETGVPSWRRVVRDGVDPGDPAALTALLERALQGQPFGRRAAPAG
jgi:hypothetical protein